MRGSVQLFLIVGKAALMATVGCFALTLVAVRLGLKPEPKSAAVEAAFAMTFLIPMASAIRWLFRKVQTVYPWREARAISIAFGVFTPLALAVSMVFAEISGG